MKKITRIIALVITLCNSHSAFTMEKEAQTHLLFIPGINGCGENNVNTIFPYFQKNPSLVHPIKTPLLRSDFGQDKCQGCLIEKINWLKTNEVLQSNDNLILHGLCQGTATTINYAAKNPANIKGLILEGIVLSGNSAIEHILNKQMLPGISYFPPSYYLLPYLARLMWFQFYSPIGEQPIDNVDNLPKDLPIILLHNTKDRQLSFKDAQALYAFLTLIQKNRNVYFFPQESEFHEHLSLLGEKHTEKIAAINTILKTHNLLPLDPNNPTKNILDLSPYQPIAQQEWLDHFYTLVNKEKNLKYVDPIIKMVITCAALYALFQWLER